MKSLMVNLSLGQRKAIVLALICLLLISATAWIMNLYPALTIRSDFLVRWYAVDRLYQDGRNLYDEQNGNEIDAMRGRTDGNDSGMDFYYPAHILLFIGLLGLLPYETANLIWLILIQLFFLAGLAIMIWVRKWPPTMNQATVFILAALFAVPTFQHLMYGQFNTIGILSLSLTYLALYHKRYGLAGVLTIGLTFKPQAHVLTIVYLLLWIISDRRRWRFLLTFVSAAFIAWLFAEILQPGWVIDFLQSMRRYSDLNSVADILWNPNQLLSGVLILTALAIFWRNRDKELQSPAFGGTLALSLATWSIIYPLAFTFHTLILVVAIILIASNFKVYLSQLYRPLLIILTALYIGGWIGVLLRATNLFGLVAYVIILPIIIIITALPLCLNLRVPGQAATLSRESGQ